MNYFWLKIKKGLIHAERDFFLKTFDNRTTFNVIIYDRTMNPNKDRYLSNSN